MNIFKRFSFAKQLICFLLAALIVTFIVISWALTNSIQQFIGNNAYNQARIFADNVKNGFEKEILKIEEIPDNIININGTSTLQCTSGLPIMLMKTYSQLAGCSMHYNISDTNRKNHTHILATRQIDGNIRMEEPVQCPFCPPDPSEIIRRNKQGGFWVYSHSDQKPTLAFCYPLPPYSGQLSGYLKLDFPLKTITDIICDNKLYKYGHLFIIDSLGNILAHPFQQFQGTTSFTNPVNNKLAHPLKQKITKGETGSCTYYDNDTKYFVYYEPIPCMHWRLGIVCPYNETLNSSYKLYWIIFLCLGGGLLFLFIGIIKIVHLLSFPLNQLAFTARRIADGQFDVEIPHLKSSNEINELYDSFRYMQHSLINYIEKLKISTAEKEQRNSEMNLARRIQQRFLPHHITLPDHLQLAAELRQSQEVGGDFYEFFIRGNRLYFTIGDVSGKGTPAAFYMVSITKLFRYVANSHNSTATICNIINKQMCEDAEDDMYVTMFMGILDINTGIMTYTNAGHPYPLVIHENGETNFLSKYPDVPIGILENHVFSEHTYTIHKNNSLLFYTDGITDAENPAGQFYGKEKLVHCVEMMQQHSPQEIIQAILDDNKKHIGIRKQSDDLTLLLVRFLRIP